MCTVKNSINAGFRPHLQLKLHSLNIAVFSRTAAQPLSTLISDLRHKRNNLFRTISQVTFLIHDVCVDHRVEIDRLFLFRDASGRNVADNLIDDILKSALESNSTNLTMSTNLLVDKQLLKNATPRLWEILLEHGAWFSSCSFQMQPQVLFSVKSRCQIYVTQQTKLRIRLQTYMCIEMDLIIRLLLILIHF